MPYFTDEPSFSEYVKYAASEGDVKGLLWLTKLQVK